MKIAIRNERTPRKYSQFKTVFLMDDAGIIWGRIEVGEGRISINHLQGVTMKTNVMNGMGDYLVGDDVTTYRYSWCPNYEDQGRNNPKVYDTMTNKVKCSKCGHTWGSNVEDRPLNVGDVYSNE